jgi:hypothetical protein
VGEKCHLKTRLNVSSQNMAFIKPLVGQNK